MKNFREAAVDASLSGKLGELSLPVDQLSVFGQSLVEATDGIQFLQDMGAAMWRVAS